MLPIHFYFTGFFRRNRIQSNEKRNEKYIVSLTTFPARIGKVWLVIETILRQKVKPDAIVLWLYKNEFNGKDSLPKKLLKLEKRGLQIRFCDDNLMPHKKYYYTMLEYPDANMITIDDDVFYPPNLVKNLIRFHQIYPHAICCPIIRKIKFKNEAWLPYSEWNYLRENTSEFYCNLAIGVGAPLYPVGSLNSELYNKKELIRLALRTDDLWLKVMSLKNNTKVVSMAGEYPRFFIPISIKNNLQLMDSNIGNGQNDKVFNDLIRYYKISVSNFDEN